MIIISEYENIGTKKDNTWDNQFINWKNFFL